MHMRHIVMWPVRLYNIYQHYSINGTNFFFKKVTEHRKMCFDFLYKFCPKHFAV